MDELYKKHRPTLFKGVYGQTEAIGVLTKLCKGKKIPHAVLFSGPSGCGKTTLARILKSKLECADHDFLEVNAADFRGIESIRDIRKSMSLAPMGGKVRMWLIDECQKLSNDAQNAFLKMLEDTPKHVYFILATTEPQKLLTTVKTRCTEIRVQALGIKAMKDMLLHILSLEKKKVGDDVLDKIIDVSNGSARKALVILNQILDLEDEEDQLNAIAKADSERQAIEVARVLMNPKTRWPDVAKLLKDIDEEPESMRRMILGYASSTLLKSGMPRAYVVLDIFRDHFFDSGKPGLVAACYEVVTSK